MNILITGGLGFIGSYFAEKLSSKSNKIIILDNLSGYSKSAMKSLNEIENIHIYDEDITNKDISKYFSDIDIVYHFAANSKISEGVDNPNIDFEITTIGTHNVLMAMMENNVKSIVFSSGSGVYGDQNDRLLDESFGPLLPVSFYGASKLCAEAYISSFCGMKNFKAYIFRFANVVGYRQTHGVAYDFYHKLKQNKLSLEVLGNGYQSKSYIDVNDIYEAIQLAITKQTNNIEVYNIGTNDYVTVRDIASIVLEALNLKNVSIEYGDDSFGWVGDVPVVRFSSEKIRSLGWKNQYTSHEAIKRAINFIIQDDNI